MDVSFYFNQITIIYELEMLAFSSILKKSETRKKDLFGCLYHNDLNVWEV